MHNVDKENARFRNINLAERWQQNRIEKSSKWNLDSANRNCTAQGLGWANCLSSCRLIEYCKRLVHVIASSLVCSTHCQSFYYWRVLVPGTSLYPQVPRFRFVSVRKPGRSFFLRVFPVFPLMKHHCKRRRCAFYEMKQPIIRAKNSTTKTRGALHLKEGRFLRIRCWASAASSPCAL